MAMTRLLAAARALLIAAALVAAGQGAPAQTFGVEQSTPARAAILVDLKSGAVLLEKNADTPLPPASMSKLMVLDIVFEALDAGRLSLDDEFRISENAASMGGSRMFLREGELVSVEDLLRGTIVQSGNDSAVALAEALAGTEEAFAAFMNRRAGEIGLDDSHFVNATGWPHPDHRMSVRDLATLAERVVTRFPEYYHYFSEPEFTWDDITQQNRNPLLGLGLGVDGMKTGHTEDAGYGLISSAKRGDRRIVLVLAGLESQSQRKQEAERLVNWAFRAFETRRLYRAGEPLLEADVWIGAEARVPLAPAEDVVVTVPFGLGTAPRPAARYSEPVEAPLEKGAQLGEIRVAVEGMPEVAVPLVATRAVPRGGFLARVEAAAALALRRLAASGS
jgi:D-alanyl-D-alanine carboxypeptidase (penicillin-binding protein 5/6)